MNSDLLEELNVEKDKAIQKLSECKREESETQLFSFKPNKKTIVFSKRKERLEEYKK